MNLPADPFPRRCIVAVVDDDPAVRSALRFSLEVEGLEVRALSGGQEALELAGREAICCYVIELRLQDIDGLALAERLRQIDADLPIVLIGSNPSRLQHRIAEQRGIKIVEKPLMGAALTDELRRLLI